MHCTDKAEALRIGPKTVCLLMRPQSFGAAGADWDDKDLARTLVSIAQWVRAASKCTPRPPHVMLVFGGTQDPPSVHPVSGRSSLPDHSLSCIWGAIRSMRQEYPSLEITCVEIDAQMEAAQRASMLLSELMWPESGTREILHHNGSRHTRQIVSQSVSPFAHLGLALETTR